MKKKIDEAREKGDSVGGIFKIYVTNPPIGLGSYIQWDKRLDGRLAQAVMSIPGIKGVEIGLGFSYSKHFGSEVHDEIFYSKERGFYRITNNAGGIEGGVTNGEDIIIKAVMKPIPTLRKPLKSVDIITKEEVLASKERSDVCAVTSAMVIAESVVAIEIAKAFLEKFGSDNMEEVKRNYLNYIKYLKNF